MRYLAAPLDAALANEQRMAFVAGPRQVGKTTLARHLLAQAACERLYFNWDVEADRRQIVRDPSSFFTDRLPIVRRAASRPRIAFAQM